MENTTFTSKNFPTISHAPFLIGDFHVTSGKPFVKGAQDCERSQAKAVGLWQKRWPTRRWQRGLPLKVMGSKCGINHEGFMKMCDKLWRVCSYCDILKIGSLKKSFIDFIVRNPISGRLFTVAGSSWRTTCSMQTDSSNCEMTRGYTATTAEDANWFSILCKATA